MGHWKGFVVALAALVFGTAAFAQEGAPAVRHLYAGFGFGQAQWRPGCPSNVPNCDDTNPGLRAFAGYQLNRIFSAEAAFGNYGKATGPNADIKGHGWEASGLAAWPVWREVSVFARLGIYRGVVKGGGQFAGHTETNYGATYGLGVQADFTRNIAARLEWQMFPGIGGSSIIDNDIQLVTLSALWRFR